MKPTYYSSSTKLSTIIVTHQTVKVRLTVSNFIIGYNERKVNNAAILSFVRAHAVSKPSWTNSKISVLIASLHDKTNFIILH